MDPPRYVLYRGYGFYFLPSVENFERFPYFRVLMIKDRDKEPVQHLRILVNCGATPMQRAMQYRSSLDREVERWNQYYGKQ